MSKAEWARTTKLIEAALGILEDQSPMTIRQLFYQLVSRGLIENCPAHYKMVIRLMTKARDDDRVPFEYIVDRSRPAYPVSAWENPAEYADLVKQSYRKDYWAMQPEHVEIWVEKDAIIGSIERVASDLGVTIRVGRGFLSTTRVHEIATFFSTVKKEITIFYLGDHDPSGIAIEKDIENRLVRRMVGSGLGYTPFFIQRLAIFEQDIKEFNLPPLRIKETDSRAASFLKDHSGDCVELDALPANELRDRIFHAVSGKIDRELWDRAIAAEEVELNSIRDLAGMLKKLKPPEVTA